MISVFAGLIDIKLMQSVINDFWNANILFVSDLEIY